VNGDKERDEETARAREIHEGLPEYNNMYIYDAEVRAVRAGRGSRETDILLIGRARSINALTTILYVTDFYVKRCRFSKYRPGSNTDFPVFVRRFFVFGIPFPRFALIVRAKFGT